MTFWEIYLFPEIIWRHFKETINRFSQIYMFICASEQTNLSYDFLEGVCVCGGWGGGGGGGAGEHIFNC